jgi:hypothetical protein
MRLILILLVLGSTGSAAFAQSTTCKSQAVEKKLSGAALTSFTKKCENDAKAACDLSANEKKLAGAARSSFAKKCLSDALGT